MINSDNIKKGFTLIELLVVIAILAIIAVIAFPIAINMINEAKEETDFISDNAFTKALKTKAM